MKSKARLKLGILTVLCGIGMAGTAGAADITSMEPKAGTYDKIDRVIDVNGTSSDNEGIHYASGGTVTVQNGGTISLSKPSTTLYGIRVSDGGQKDSKVQVTGGNLTIHLDNSGSTGGSRVHGAWVYAGYNSTPGGTQPTYKGSVLALQDTNIDIKTNSHALGLLSGSDFGNNGVGGGQIDSNGNLNISVYSATAYKTVDFTNAMGLVSYGEGLINLNGRENTIAVKSDGLGNATNTIISGLYVSKGGKINSSEDSNLNISVTGKNIFGISAGYYDQLGENISYQGKSKIDLKGNNIIELSNEAQKKYAIGVHSAIRSSISLGSADIRFMNVNTAHSDYLFGLNAEEEGKIDVGSLYIGTNGSSVTDPTKITAILTEGKEDLLHAKYDNSGTINVNTDGKGTVQVNGQVKALDDGTINLNLTNDKSYLYGNTRVVYGSSKGTINLKLDNGAKWTNVRGDSDLDSEVTNLTLGNGAWIDMTDTTYVNEATHGKYQSIYVDNNMDGTGGTIYMDIDATKNTDNSDRLYIKGEHTGTHYIKLNNIGAGDDGAKGTVLVSVNKETDLKNGFKVHDSEGTLYWNKYALKSQQSADTTGTYNTDWYLDRVDHIDPGDKPGTNVDISHAVSGLGYYGFRDMDKLMRRMGELRHNGEE